MKRLSILFIFALAVAISADAQKIYAIAMANTVDNGVDGKGGIGKSCLVDYDNFIREITIIGEYLEYEVDARPFIGQECTKENLLSTLAGINPTNKDIVFFYYSGHGTHAPNDNDLLPQICFKYSSIAHQEHFLALRAVKEKLQGKGARLNILMADCCNNIVPGVMPRALQREGGATAVTDNAAANYKKLFLENTGTIIMTGCEKGQTSAGIDEIGGVYSSAFWDELASLGKGGIEATWAALTQSTKKQTAYDTNNEQIPYTDLSGLNNAGTATPPIGTTPVNVVSAGDQNLADVLKPLIDTSKSDGQRLAMVNEILNNYFTSDAKVVTVGRNNVNIGGENIGDYLRRISINKRITGLVILSSSKGYGGKTSFIRVHEVRK